MASEDRLSKLLLHTLENAGWSHLQFSPAHFTGDRAGVGGKERKGAREIDLGFRKEI